MAAQDVAVAARPPIHLLPGETPAPITSGGARRVHAMDGAFMPPIHAFVDNIQTCLYIDGHDTIQTSFEHPA